MAIIDIRRKHNLEIAEACDRVDQIALVLQTKLNAKYTWQNDKLLFKCPGASGHIEVGGNELALSVQLGMLLSPMKGALRQSIEQYVDEALKTDTTDANAENNLA